MDGWMQPVAHPSNEWMGTLVDTTHPWMDGYYHSPIHPMEGWINMFMVIGIIITSIIINCILAFMVSVFKTLYYHYFYLRNMDWCYSLMDEPMDGWMAPVVHPSIGWMGVWWHPFIHGGVASIHLHWMGRMAASIHPSIYPSMGE